MGNFTMNPYVIERMFMNESDANNVGYFTLLTGLVMLFVIMLSRRAVYISDASSVTVIQ